MISNLSVIFGNALAIVILLAFLILIYAKLRHKSIPEAIEEIKEVFEAE